MSPVRATLTRLAALLILATGTARAQPSPQVRVQFDPPPPVLVGQQVRVDVTVLVPNFFLSPPQFPPLEIPGVVVTLLDGAANSTEKIGGVSYAGIQRSYAITAQQGGTITLPPAAITFQYAAEPGQPGVPATVNLPAEKIVVEEPNGETTTVGAAPVGRVVITQTLDRETKHLKVGDALTRTIESYAPHTQSMMIPPPKLDTPAGVRAYVHEPVLTEVTDGRGRAIGGRRVDRVTYSFDRAGDYTLPAVEIGWIDAATGQRQVARAPEIEISVARHSSPEPTIAPPVSVLQRVLSALRDDRDVMWWLIGAATFAVAATWFARRRGMGMRDWLARRERERGEAEPEYFARVTRSCAVGDASATYSALVAWSRRIGMSSPSELAALDAEADAEIGKLEQHLFAGSSHARVWNGDTLTGTLGRVRRRVLRQGRSVAVRQALPPLNP